MGAYAASKAGVQRLTESLADELKDRGITVNAILPGMIDTPRNRLDMPDADFSRWVAPAAIAEVIVFLASDAAAAVTGAAIPVIGRGWKRQRASGAMSRQAACADSRIRRPCPGPSRVGPSRRSRIAR